MSNPLTDMIGKFFLGLIDGAVKKWLAPYVAPGKLTQDDANAIVAGIHADIKLGLLMEAAKPATPATAA